MFDISYTDFHLIFWQVFFVQVLSCLRCDNWSVVTLITFLWMASAKKMLQKFYSTFPNRINCFVNVCKRNASEILVYLSEQDNSSGRHLQKKCLKIWFYFSEQDKLFREWVCKNKCFRNSVLPFQTGWTVANVKSI